MRSAARPVGAGRQRRRALRPLRRGRRRRRAAAAAVGWRARPEALRRALLLDRAQPRDVALVLLVASRRRRGRRCRRRRNTGPWCAPDWRRPRARRGPDWRSAPAAGRRSGRCCRRRLLDLAARDRPAERALAADQAVDDGRVGLQPHLLLQPVDEHGGDARALVRLAGLLLDDGGERDELLRRLDRQVGGSGAPRPPAARGRCACCMRWIICSRVVPRRELVGVGQQRAFARESP